MPRIARTKFGGSAALIAVLALCLILIGGAFFVLTMFFGGSRQLKNASDAGALNVAREIVDDGVFLLPGDELKLFKDVAGVKATMANFNRIAARAYLTGLNAQSMREREDNSDKAYQAMRNIATRLALHVRDANNRKKFYMDYARPNPLTMLGSDSKFQAADLNKWSHSFMDRDAESNIEIKKEQLPIGLSGNIKVPTIPPDEKDKKRSFLIGYRGYEIGEKRYWLIPFKLNERPSLISGSAFKTNSIAPNWNPVAIPNAFSAIGQSQNSSNLTQVAKSWSQANPDKVFNASIPSGFVRIVLNAPTYEIYIGPKSFRKGTAKGFKPWTMNFDVPWLWAMWFGECSVKQFFGNEYVAPTVYPAIFGIPPFKKSNAYNHLLQRVQQINPDSTESSIKKLLLITPISTAPNRQVYYLCNVPDVRYTELYPPKPKLVCAPESLYRLLKDQMPDGRKKSEEEENARFTNFGLVTYYCTFPQIPLIKFPTYTNTITKRTWQAGTGYDRCLGTLEISKRYKVVVLFPPCVGWPP